MFEVKNLTLIKNSDNRNTTSVAGSGTLVVGSRVNCLNLNVDLSLRAVREDKSEFIILLVTPLLKLSCTDSSSMVPKFKLATSKDNDEKTLLVSVVSNKI